MVAKNPTKQTDRERARAVMCNMCFPDRLCQWYKGEASQDPAAPALHHHTPAQPTTAFDTTLHGRLVEKHDLQPGIRGETPSMRKLP